MVKEARKKPSQSRKSVKRRQPASPKASQPMYNIRVEKNVYAPMRDDVRIAADVYRPDAEGTFPALLAMSPYGKEVQSLRLPPQPHGIGSLFDGCVEAGDTEYIVSRGYVHVIADLRGMGYSEGEYVGIHSQKEAQDGYDLVEWIAQQPWCSGDVGTIGYSYYGEMQASIATENPPHLKAVMPCGGHSDLYRNFTYQGGVLNTFLYGLWDGRGGACGYARKSNGASVMVRELPKEELDRRVKEVLNNPDLRQYSNIYHLLNYPEKNPAFFDILLNPYDGPFYWERSSYRKFDRIKVPVYSSGCWSSMYNIYSSTALYNGVNSPKKLLMQPPGQPARPWVELNEEIIRWYDYWLKGIDNGIMDEPPVKIFVMGINKFRFENEWPLARMQPTKYYLRCWEGLSTQPETFQTEPDCFVQEPLYMSTRRGSLSYLTPPLSEDLEVTGPIALYLYASIDSEDTNWKVTLYDVDPGASESLRLLTRGWLKASHRALDQGKSKPLQPYHPHTSSEPVVPGEIYEYAIEIGPVSNVFKAGHRIKLQIESMDSPTDPGMAHVVRYHICSSETTVHKIYRDTKHSSHLLLPVIPKEM